MDTSKTDSSDDPSPDKQKLDKLKKAVLEKRPILAEIIRKCGHKTLFDYAKDYLAVNLNPNIKLRQKEFIQTLHKIVKARLGQEVADSVAKQLKKYYVISTIDHLGPITHPWFLNTNLLIAAPYIECMDPELHNVLAIACSNVSLNNTSFPRGLLFSSCINGEVKTHRLSFLPSNSHACSAYGFRPFTEQDIEKMHKLLREKVSAKEVNQREADIIHKLLDEIYNQPNVLACKTYAEQITITNFALWKKFFPKKMEANPNLIYIEQETLVVELLMDHHLFEDTVINHILFDPKYDEALTKYFDGVLYAFTQSENKGTYLFWGLSEDKNYRIQLWRKGNFLESSDGTFKIELTPESIKNALEQKKIVPSIMLIFMVISFYYGLKCLGGFSQIDYLTAMKNAYIKMHADKGNYRSIELCARAQTKETVDFSVAFMQAPNGNLIQANGLDLILYGDKKHWSGLNEELKEITVEEALNPGMPDFYRFIYTSGEGDPDLMTITPEQVTQITGLDKKINPICQITNYNL